MTCVFVDLPYEGIKGFDASASEQGKSRASVLRDVIARYRLRLERPA